MIVLVSGLIVTNGSAITQAPTADKVTAETALGGVANLSNSKVLTRKYIISEIYRISEEQQYGRAWFLIELAQHESDYLRVPKLLDSNNKYSMGLFHFQQATFDHYCWREYFIGNDIANIDTQIECAIKMDRDGLVPTAWFNSYRKIMAGK